MNFRVFLNSQAQDALTNYVAEMFYAEGKTLTFIHVVCRQYWYYTRGTMNNNTKAIQRDVLKVVLLFYVYINS